MLKSDNVVQNIILNGYNKNIVTELPKAIIDDFLEREIDKLSEAFDIFIDKVQNYEIIDDEDGNLNFGEVYKVGTNSTCELNNCNKFIEVITNKLAQIINRKPLKTILLEENAISIKLESSNPQDMFTYNFIKYLIPDFDNNDLKSIEKLATIFECQDLCLVFPDYGVHNEGFFVKLSDLYSLLTNKGINKDDVLLYISSFPLAESGIYFDFDQILNLGKRLPNNEHKLIRSNPQENE